MSFTPRKVELGFDYQGGRFTATFSWATIARFEEDTGQSILDFAGRLAGGGTAPRLSDMAKFLLAALGPHHPDLTLDHAMELITLPEVQAIFAQGIAQAMPQPNDDREAGAAASGNVAKAAKAQASAGKKR
jgi:hypothetical protein